ncbi:SRPBCC family protein [Marivibrio halodurans]|uniref:SRPBCC family protein n=1 Tax=Marivibrio halodurans TaxID=2039722 RepID=A0A8J7RW96_9PROT|nr:SRPBCC family protein [Marivibrio halodurans]MBP5855550.1 SRPBCC family protein [Marivibrio halodurans]
MPLAEAECAIPAPPDAVWKVAGGFGSLADWHPAVARCTLEAEGRQRRLILVDGGELLEALLQRDDAARAYAYRIVESPMPVDNYQATFHIEDDGAGGSIAHWSARFDVREDEDPAPVERSVQGIFESGLEQLRQLASNM